MSDADHGLPEPEDGPDPWCTWCHAEPEDGRLPFRIRGEDGRWPPAFCSLECAARWGNAAHQDRIYHIERQGELRTDGGEDRFTDCEECGEPVDMLEAGVWKAPNDEQWWHEGCYDKVEKAEDLAERIRNLMVPEGEFDGLSNDFHDQLDAAQGFIETAVERERLKRDQGIGPYDTETAQDGDSHE